jgi:histidinol-phosphatase (PHP family)
MAIDELDEYVSLVQQAREAWIEDIDIRLGLEADYLPGYEGWLDRQLNSRDFHYVLGSVHPQVQEYRREYWGDDPLENQRVYFELLAEAAETRLFDCLAHPDLIKNEIAPAWYPDRIMPIVCQALDRIAATDVAMELNTSGANKVMAELNPFPEMLLEIRRREIPVVIGSDAHEPSRVADRFEIALDLLSSLGFAEVSVFLERQRHDISIERARDTLRRLPVVSEDKGQSSCRCGL